MLVVEKTRHIRVNLSGEGVDKVAALLREKLPKAVFLEEEDAVEWKSSELAREIRASKTPGKLLRAYRKRAGLTLVELAAAIGSRHPNLSAIENERRPVGLDMARKLGEALGVDYQKFLE
jgi:plasmid maintenance system antidote protein VapI